MSTFTPTKTAIYDPTSLKTTTDDSLAPYLTTLPPPYNFTQTHTHSTIRLSLGYSAVILAGLLFYLDNRHGWDATKPYTLPACAAYFLLNGALTAYVYFVERGCVCEGQRKGGQMLKIWSRGKKHSPEYEIEVKYQAKGGTVWEEKVVKGVFMQWFSKEGYLQRKEFAGWLAGSVDVIGQAEKERMRLEGKSLEAKEEGKSEVLLTGGTGEDVDVIEVEAETSKMPSGKKGKARKKV
jgi:hypothetical protein